MLKNGIPYTATNSAIYAGAKLTLKAECSNKNLKDEKIICQIVTPKNDPPVTVTAAAHNTFDLVFKKVKQKTPVSLKFTVEGTKITETLKFSVLPEPEISAISHDPATVKVGKEVSFKLNPVLTYTP